MARIYSDNTITISLTETECNIFDKRDLKKKKVRILNCGSIMFHNFVQNLRQ